MSSKRTKAGRRASRRNYCVNLATSAVRRERAHRRYAAEMRKVRRDMMHTLIMGGFVAFGASILRASRLGLLGARR